MHTYTLKTLRGILSTAFLYLLVPVVGYHHLISYTTMLFTDSISVSLTLPGAAAVTPRAWSAYYRHHSQVRSSARLQELENSLLGCRERENLQPCTDRPQGQLRRSTERPPRLNIPRGEQPARGSIFIRGEAIIRRGSARLLPMYDVETSFSTIPCIASPMLVYPRYICVWGKSFVSGLPVHSGFLVRRDRGR